MSNPDVSIRNVLIAGLGGQGVITASDVLADAAFRAGFDVKKSEIHGMSQRGGSVVSDVRFAARVYSPTVPPGEADFLLVLAPDQVENNRHRLRPGGVLLTPDVLPPGAIENRRSLNIALLGAMSVDLPEIDPAAWLAALRSRLPERLHAANERAFQAGRDAALAGRTESAAGAEP